MKKSNDIVYDIEISIFEYHAGMQVCRPCKE